MLRILLLLALAPRAAAVGWSQFRGGPYRDGTTTTVGPTSSNLLWRFLLRGTSQGAPTVHPDESMVYVGGTDGFYGINSDGTFGWYLRIDQGIVNSAAAVSTKHNLVVFGGMNGGIYAVDARTGLTKWTVWTKKATKGTRSDPYIYSSPVLDDREDLLYIGAADGLYAVELESGRVKWIFDAKGEPVWSSPALSADQKTVYVGGIDNFVHAIDAATGIKVWEWETGGFPDDPDDPDVDSSPAVSRRDGTVYVGSFDNRLHAIDGRTGQVKWSYRTDDDVISSPSVARDGKTIYIPSISGKVHAVSDKGEKRWSTDLGHAIMAEPVLDGANTLYIGDDDGKVYALDAKNGKIKWSHDFGDKVRGEPAVANGRLYVATINADAFLHCIGGEGGSSSHSSSSKASDKDAGGSSFGKVVVWLAVLLGLGFVAYAALTVGRPMLEQHGFRLPQSMQRDGFRMQRDGFEAAPRDDGTYAAPFVELQESMMSDKEPGGAVI